MNRPAFGSTPNLASPSVSRLRLAWPLWCISYELIPEPGLPELSLYTSLDVTPGIPSMPVGRIRLMATLLRFCGLNVRSFGAVPAGSVCAWKTGMRSEGETARPAWCWRGVSAGCAGGRRGGLRRLSSWDDLPAWMRGTGPGWTWRLRTGCQRRSWSRAWLKLWFLLVRTRRLAQHTAQAMALPLQLQLLAVVIAPARPAFQAR